MKLATWAHYSALSRYQPYTDMSLTLHWSRKFEYPWVLMNGDFRIGQWVLDAGGSNSPLPRLIWPTGAQVSVLDLEPAHPQIVKGDIKKLPYPDNSFHKTMCISVLEHIDDPLLCLKELWRVTSKRLIITMDIAGYKRWNHTIDEDVAKEALAMFGLNLPPQPSDIMTQIFAEVEPKENECKEVELKVLCFFCDKDGTSI